MDPTIKKVQERIKYVEQDENMLHAYRMHEMTVYDFNISVYVAKREGIIKIFLAPQNNISPKLGVNDNALQRHQ
jgi:uncharacterized protein YjfI (DUF2170 family)